MFLKKSKIDIDQNLVESFIELYKNPNGSIKRWPGEPTLAYDTMAHGIPVQGYESNPYPWFEQTFNDSMEEFKKMLGTDQFTLKKWWFNYGIKGTEYRIHAHYSEWMVGILYVNVPEGSGILEFIHEGKVVPFHPTQGDLVIHPGVIPHRVSMCNNEGYRITVVFELNPI